MLGKTGEKTNKTHTLRVEGSHLSEGRDGCGEESGDEASGKGSGRYSKGDSGSSAGGGSGGGSHLLRSEGEGGCGLAVVEMVHVGGHGGETTKIVEITRQSNVAVCGS